MSEALTFPCSRCGAVLPVDPTSTAVTCAYCRASVPIPSALREQAIEYAARVAAARDRARDDQAAARIHRWSAEQQRRWWAIPLAFFGIFFALWGALMALGPRVASAFSWVLPVGMYGLMGALGVRYYRAYQRAKQGGGERVAVAPSTCARCGGPIAFAAGVQSTTCPACSAVALPGRTLQRDLVGAVEREARDAEIARGRAERQTYRSTAGAQTFARWYLRIAMGWPIAALVALGLGGGAYSVIEGLVNDDAAGVQKGTRLLVLGAVTLGLVATGAAIYVGVFRATARALDRAAGALAARTSALVTRDGTRAALDWLDAHWQGTAPMEVMASLQESDRWTITGLAAGMPFLIVMIHGSKHAPRGLHVLLAAPAAREARTPGAENLRRLGFEVTSSWAGVLLSSATCDAALSVDLLDHAIREAAAITRA